MVDNDNWIDCPWDAGEVRLLVRGLAKCLIQARWLNDPDFLRADQVNAWFKPDGAELRGTDRSAQTLLGHAATNARRLQAAGFLPATWHTSATLVPGLAVAGELASVVHGLLSGDVEDDNPVAALTEAARRPVPPANWVWVIDWDVLQQLLPLLDQLPKPKPRPPAVVPHWDKDAGVLKYGRWVARWVAAGATNLRTLLDAFDAEGWPHKIPSPFPGNVSAAKDTLARLNDGMKHIRFGSARGGTEVSWASLVKKARTPKQNAKSSSKRRTPGR